MPIDKAHIIGEIRRIAKATGGKAPGSHALKSQSGIKKSDWYPHIWLRWSDALMEAGYAPNQFQPRTSDELLMQAYTGLIRELGRVPIEGEIRREAKDDKNVPSHTSFSRFGRKEELIDAAAQFCAKRTDLNDVLSILERRERLSRKSPALDPDVGSNVTTGFVYLMKSGQHYKIGRTNSVGRRTSELAIKIPIPPKTIHHIETDDPVGVESYWHKRFEEKRGEGEWFNISAEDVKAFKRWKRIV